MGDELRAARRDPLSVDGPEGAQHAMPARPLEVPDQRDRNRDERKEEKQPRDADDPRIERRVDVQIERDAFQIVHQHPALPFAIPRQEIGIVHQTPRKLHTINLHEKGDERAEGALYFRHPPADAAERLIEKDSGQDELRQMSGSAESELPTPIRAHKKQPYQKDGADQK